MSADPGSSVRRMKDSSLVRAAEAVRDGKASAMISAGNTGATMASALLRMGRIKGVSRPAIATPIPVPGHGPTILLDAGANAECQADWLVQFAQMGVVFARTATASSARGSGCSRSARRPSKGTPLVKETHALLDGSEALRAAGRHLRRQRRGPRRHDRRRRRGRHRRLHRQRRAQDARGRHAHARRRHLRGLRHQPRDPGRQRGAAPGAAAALRHPRPRQHRGAMLLGVDGLCLISHGSSSATAIVNAIRVAKELHDAGIVESLRAAVAPA